MEALTTTSTSATARVGRCAAVVAAVALLFVAGCSGGASAPEPFTVSEATVTNAADVRAAFVEYASQWRDLIATDGFRYDTGAGVLQNMTTSQEALVAAVPGLAGALTTEVAAYRQRAGSSADEVALAEVEKAVTEMSSAIAELPGVRTAAFDCFQSATVNDQCTPQQDRLSALLDYLESALDSLTLVPGASDPEDSVA